VTKHVPALVDEAIEMLKCKKGGVYVDCTLGSGGHAQAMLETSGKVRVVGIDCDPFAVERARDSLKEYGSRFVAVNENFVNIDVVLRTSGVEWANGILFDLGLSTEQLEDGSRGFSFQREGPLDMRMDTRQGTTASQVLNDLSEKEIADVLRDFGEERKARQISRMIVRQRRERSLQTTGELSRIARRAYPYRRRTHPATKTFQAIRITVNRELHCLDTGLRKAAGLVGTGGRICVISYHSLEDRIVKNLFKEIEKGTQERAYRVLTKKPVTPGHDEISRNRGSRSARLRAVERIR